MPGDDVSHVGHTALAHFDVIFVADFMQVVMGWKVFTKQS